MPFVVMDRSASGATSRSIATSFGRSARTVGSPPVSLNDRTPRPRKIPASRTISSNRRISALGSHCRPSAGMQYVHRKLQRSVTEMRRSSATRPNVSRSGSIHIRVPGSRRRLPGDNGHVTNAVVTVSDGGSEGVREDESGDTAQTLLLEQGLGPVERRLVPDERAEVESLLAELADGGAALVVTTGGTG